jgi:hypothetical protein
MKPTSLSLTGACLALAVLAASCSKNLKTLQTPTLPPIAGGAGSDGIISSLPYGSTTGTDRQLIWDQTISGATTSVEVAVWGAYSYGEINTVEISVDSGFVMVGGSASIQAPPGGNPTINSLLTASWPVDDGTYMSYYAANKDHDQVYFSDLYAYVVGIKLYGPGHTLIPMSTITSHMYLAEGEGGPADHRTKTITVPSAYTSRILSGGAFDDYGTGPGNLLTEADWNTTSTTASGKDHIQVDVCPIYDEVLAMDNNPITGFGLINITNFSGSADITEHSQSLSINVGAGWLPIGVGAQSTYTGQGRMLYEMFCNNPTYAVVASKDQVNSDISGTLSGIVSAIQPAQ